ncbi:hypothetical protein GCM10027034_06510 [Ramlibacter solisilvae]|uniref:Uncharacterized protein n=1 Tax=Ramlibacter tataouinensis TaxID=94132 RepID=A0A127JYH3_9BURK|nr:hypothetical protein [Ramlibacter tataouinensis]AMO24945.1 hypothetical protein UC35_21560 [Ramlibacter tataouinensis]
MLSAKRLSKPALREAKPATWTGAYFVVPLPDGEPELAPPGVDPAAPEPVPPEGVPEPGAPMAEAAGAAGLAAAPGPVVPELEAPMPVVPELEDPEGEVLLGLAPMPVLLVLLPGLVAALPGPGELKGEPYEPWPRAVPAPIAAMAASAMATTDVERCIDLMGIPCAWKSREARLCRKGERHSRPLPRGSSRS